MTKKILSFLLGLITIFTLTSCNTVTGIAATIELPAKVIESSKSEYQSNGTSAYKIQNGDLYIDGSASDDAVMYPFFLAEKVNGQNAVLTQYGSTYPNIDIFAALANSTLLKKLSPKRIIITMTDQNNFSYRDIIVPKFENGKLTLIYYYEYENTEGAWNQFNGTTKIKYTYDKNNNLTKIKSTVDQLDTLPGIEDRGNQFTYQDNKLSTASGIDDGGEYKTSHAVFDTKGKITSYQSTANTQGESGIHSSITITYDNNKPVSVVLKGKSKEYNYNVKNTITFSYNNLNLTKITFNRYDGEEKYNNNESWQYSYLY